MSTLKEPDPLKMLVIKSLNKKVVRERVGVSNCLSHNYLFTEHGCK